MTDAGRVPERQIVDLTQNGADGLEDAAVALGVQLSEVVAVLGTAHRVAANFNPVGARPAWDAVENGPILAYSQNGEMMSVRDKGPLWMIYPFDLNEDYRSEVIYSRSIWQLVKIEVVP